MEGKYKCTEKIQSLLTDDEFVQLNRLIFWDQTKGSKHKTISSYVRHLIKKELLSRPVEDYKPIKHK